MQALQLPSLLNRLAGNGAFTDEARTTCERAFFVFFWLCVLRVLFSIIMYSCSAICLSSSLFSSGS